MSGKKTEDAFIIGPFLLAYHVCQCWCGDQEEGDDHKSKGDFYLIEHFEIHFEIHPKQSDPERGTKEIYTSMRDMERFFQVVALFFSPEISFLVKLMQILQKEELEFVDDLRALYDKKLISNEAKVRYTRITRRITWRMTRRMTRRMTWRMTQRMTRRMALCSGKHWRLHLQPDGRDRRTGRRCELHPQSCQRL